MGIDDVFEGARNVYTFFNAFRVGLIEALGAEKALAISNQIIEAMGTHQGQILKEQAGDKEFGVKEAAELVKGFLGGLGISFEVLEESPTMVRTKCGRCSAYEGSQRAGVDELLIETMCRSGEVNFSDVFVKQLNPNLSYQLIKFRSAPDDFCEEAIVLRAREDKESKRQLWRAPVKEPGLKGWLRGPIRKRQPNV